MTVGVVVTTNTRAGSSVSPRRPESHTFVVVQSEKGRVGVPVLIRNPQEYANEFGEAVSYGSGTDFVNAHFALGGSELYVVRAIGPSATKGALTLVNRVGSPQNAISLTAIGEGAWSQYITATIVDGTITNTVTITISYKAGATGTADEIYRNVGLDSTGAVTVQGIVDAINARSNIVVAANLNPATSTGATARLLAISATALSTGTDDTAGATSTVMTTALAAFSRDLGPGAVAVPGYLHTTIAAAVAAHCAANGRVGILAGTYGESESSIGSAAATIQGAANGQYLQLTYPWIQVPYVGSSKWIEPTGYFTGVRSRNSEDIGVWQAAAGKFGADVDGYVLALATTVTDAENSTLESQGVSVLRKIAGQVWPMGWKNLGTSSQFDSLADTDELNAVAWNCKALLIGEVFDGIDDKHVNLHKAVELCKSVVAARAAQKAYHSLNGDLGYSTDGTEDIPNSRIRVTVGFRRRRDMREIDLAVTAAAYNAPV